ncbi:MAG TPA: glycoside hydrolase family 16 protein [Tepidisphaeraceae bacterium]|nr:glycoside hydrolase family 16 protein [Tepidisphaeraceae bacterium]
MQRTFYLIVSSFLLLTGCMMPSKNAQSSNPNAYSLVWADEFTRPGPLDPKDWNFEQGFVRNEELQWYQPQNASCDDGHLVIEARRERKPNPIYNPASSVWTSRPFIDYTSASVTTAGKHTFLYGRFEMRARINTQPGSWPAFWTLGVSGGWPAQGEIDIMEYYKHTLLANFAWAGPNAGENGSWNASHKSLYELGPDWAHQFHVWRMDWNPSSIKLYCDDHLLNSQDLTQTLNRDLPGAPKNPFHQPAYLILNQAIGGTCGGDPSNTPFPIRYEIDYIRVYQKAAESNIKR